MDETEGTNANYLYDGSVDSFCVTRHSTEYFGGRLELTYFFVAHMWLKFFQLLVHFVFNLLLRLVYSSLLMKQQLKLHHNFLC